MQNWETLRDWDKKVDIKTSIESCNYFGPFMHQCFSQTFCGGGGVLPDMRGRQGRTEAKPDAELVIYRSHTGTVF